MNDEINLESIKEEIQKFVNNDLENHNNNLLNTYTNFSYENENIWFLLNDKEKLEMLKNIDYWNKRISEANTDVMGKMTLNEYIRKLERESDKFYKNISTDILIKYLRIAQNARERFFSDEEKCDNFDYNLLSRIDTYILKLNNMIK